MNRRLSRWLLFAGVLAICLGIGDAVLRNLLPVGSIVYRLVPGLHQAYVPGSSKFFVHRPENGGNWVRVDVNSDGYRGEELLASGSALRLVVFGDSFIASEFSPLKESFTERLEARLEYDLDRPVEVVNAGVVGYGPGQIARRMERVVAALKPALVIIAITSGNDFGDLVRNKLYRLDTNGNAVRNDPTLDPRLDALFEPRFPSNSGLAQTTRAAFFSLQALLTANGAEATDSYPSAERLLERAERDFNSFVVANNNRVENLFADSWDADIALRPNSPSARYKKALMKALLAEFRQIAAAEAVPLFLVVIPAAIDVVAKYDALSNRIRHYEDYRSNALSQAVSEPARDLGIPSLDLFEAFSRAESIYYRGGDDHWNASGQDLAAQLVADALITSGLLP